MATWRNDYIKKNQYSRPGLKLTNHAKGIIHYTANPGATAANHLNYFNNLSDRYASAHIFVDKSEAICIIPLDEVAYAANDGTYRGVPALKPNANYKSISVEMCQEPDGSFHPNTIARTEDVFVELCKMYGWDPIKDIVRHYDVTHKNCPAPWVSNPSEFIKFKKRVNDKLGGKKVSKPKKTQTGSTQIKKPKSSGDAYIRSVQQFVVDYGFSIAIDGIAGPLTKNGLIKVLQSELNKQFGAGLAVDGIPGPKTYAALITVRKGAKGNITKVLQAFLYIAGHNPGNLDGDFGGGTEKAVRSYQKAKGLSVDGTPGRATWTKLIA